MKVLFFIEQLGAGGKERRLLELIKSLEKTSKFTIELVLTQKNVHYKEIFELNVKIHYIERKGLKKDPTLFFKFYKITKKFKPDIIHVWGNMVAFYAIPTKVILNIPLVNNQITDAPLKVKKSLIGPKFTFKYSDKIIANSYAGLKSYNAPKNKSSVIYNGFDFNRVSTLESVTSVRDRFNIKTKYLVTMVASYSSKKDHKTFFETAKKIIDINKDVTFLTVGGGDRSKYEELVKGYEANIKLEKSQSNVESIINASDLGVLCTYTEGISNALLEFMALAKPVLVTGAGGCKELVEDGNNGYLFDQGDTDSLTQKVNELLDNQDIINSFGKRSKQIVLEKFSIKKMSDNFIGVYESIVCK